MFMLIERSEILPYGASALILMRVKHKFMNVISINFAAAFMKLQCAIVAPLKRSTIFTQLPHILISCRGREICLKVYWNCVHSIHAW